jgi:hypothetical protein
MVSVDLEIYDWIYFSLRIITIIVLYVNLLYVFPEERRLYSECQWNILCEKGKLAVNDRECELYLKNKNIYNPLIHSDRPHLVDPNIILNNITIDN